MRELPRLSAAALVVAAALSSPCASAQSAADWNFQATLYGYFPSISGQTVFPANAGGSAVSADIGTILDNLQFAFMGAFEARQGRWGLLADIIYVDVGGDSSDARALSIGRIGVPAGVDAQVTYDLKGWIGTLAGTYRAVSDTDFTVDLLAGVRVLNIRSDLKWALSGNVGSISLPDRAGSGESKEQNWDAVVGVRGRARLAPDGGWYFPYYLDIGTGESKVTWQALAGVGYTFGWGDVVAAWRYTAYQMKSDQSVEDLNFSGPAIGVSFRW